MKSVRLKLNGILVLALLIPVLAGLAAGPARAQFSNTYELMKGIEDRDMAAVRRYLFQGANINGRLEGRPGLMIAVENKDYPMLMFLLQNGALPDVRNLPSEETTLMKAAAMGDDEATRILVEYDAGVNLIDKQGRTALMKAASNRNTRVVRVLIEGGADIFQTDYSGRDAMQYAREARARSVVKLLEDAGWN